MSKLVKVLLFDSVAGRGFAYGKGENDLPEDKAAEFVAAGLAEYITAPKPSDLAEKRPALTAAKAEKR